MLRGIFATLRKLIYIYEKNTTMRIFLINVSGTGLDLTLSKITDQEYLSPDSIKQLKPQFELNGTKAESTLIEILDENGDAFDSFNFNELQNEEIENIDNLKGKFQITESFEKGLFNQFELVLNNDESVNYGKIVLNTKVYNGEEYVCGICYDGDELDSIGGKTNIIERKTRKLKL